MKQKNTIAKLVIFIAIILFTILLVKKVSLAIQNDSNLSTTDLLINTKEMSYYFIGSSRVQKSIDPSILQEQFNTKHIYNLGISGSTFLGNCILADYLLKKQTPKTIFIELSVILPELSDGFIDLLDQTNIHTYDVVSALTEKQDIRQKTLFKINLLNHYLSKKILIKEDLKNIFNYFVNKKAFQNKKIGYIGLNENKLNSTTTSFITFNEIESYSQQNTNLNSYWNYIEYLSKQSQNSNSRIIFFLPITYRKEKEKDITIPIYHALSDSMKIKYSQNFISNISNSKYLSDNNHLNSLGAENYTKSLFPLLEDYFTKSNKTN